MSEYKFKVGDKVKHTWYGFEGVILELHEDECHPVEITDGKSPHGDNFWFCSEGNLEKVLEVGDKVRHKEHGFEGYIERLIGNEDANVEITKGENPYFPTRSTYNSKVKNLEAIDKENTDEDTNVEEVIEVDINGSVKLTSPDGTVMKFELYEDFKDFMENIQNLQK